MSAEEISLHPTPPRTVKVHARGEAFRIVQLVGNLLVCSKEHGNCCCGWTVYTVKDYRPASRCIIHSVPVGDAIQKVLFQAHVLHSLSHLFHTSEYEVLGDTVKE